MQVCQIRHEREPSTRKQETASDETKKNHPSSIPTLPLNKPESQIKAPKTRFQLRQLSADNTPALPSLLRILWRESVLYLRAAPSLQLRISSPRKQMLFVPPKNVPENETFHGYFMALLLCFMGQTLRVYARVSKRRHFRSRNCRGKRMNFSEGCLRDCCFFPLSLSRSLISSPTQNGKTDASSNSEWLGRSWDDANDDFTFITARHFFDGIKSWHESGMSSMRYRGFATRYRYELAFTPRNRAFFPFFSINCEIIA